MKLPSIAGFKKHKNVDWDFLHCTRHEKYLDDNVENLCEESKEYLNKLNKSHYEYLSIKREGVKKGSLECLPCFDFDCFLWPVFVFIKKTQKYWKQKLETWYININCQYCGIYRRGSFETFGSTWKTNLYPILYKFLEFYCFTSKINLIQRTKN